MKKLFLSGFAAFVTMCCITSCNIKNGDTTDPQQGYFLVANISPDVPPLSILINGSSFSSNFAYGNYTPYYSTTAGSYTFAFYTSLSGTTPVLSSTVNLAASSSYSYFVIDSFSKIKSSFVQDNIVIPGGDSVYIRFFNFSPNAGTVALTDSASKTDLYTSRTFNDQNITPVYSNFKRMLSGTYTLQLKLADSTIATSKTYALTAGHGYTFFAKGLLNSSSDTTAIGIGFINNY